MPQPAPQLPPQRSSDSGPEKESGEGQDLLKLRFQMGGVFLALLGVLSLISSGLKMEASFYGSIPLIVGGLFLYRAGAQANYPWVKDQSRKKSALLLSLFLLCMLVGVGAVLLVETLSK